MRVFNTALRSGVSVRCVCMQVCAVYVSARVSIVYACSFGFGVIVCLSRVFVYMYMHAAVYMCNCVYGCVCVFLLVWECKSMPGFVYVCVCVCVFTKGSV